MSNEVDSLYPLILDAITEGVFTVDENFRITSFNAEAERIIGIKREDALGRRCHQVFRASICESTCALKQTIISGQSRRNIRIEALNAQMEPVPLLVSTAVLRNRSGELIGGIEVFRDVTDMETLRRQLDERHVFADIIGASEPMLELFKVLPDIAESGSAVMICGPSGTGKELVAQAIHNLSSRYEGPYVRVNCGALPDTLLESEMFGHVKGAFTGATRDRLGRFREAHGGTLLLDEVAELSPSFQVKLLRVLEDGYIQPLGGTGSVRVNVRILSATNRDLEQLIETGAFREDLYYRLGVVPVNILPLRDRRKDIPVLVVHVLRKLSLRMGRDMPDVTPGAMQVLYDYDYPGNVRELENILERSLILGRGRDITVKHLPVDVLTRSSSETRKGTVSRSLPSSRPDDRAIHPQAREIIEALRDHHWNRTEAARALGIARNTLWRRMKKFDIT